MSCRDTLREKLRRLAEHPSTNPNEAAVARMELSRLYSSMPKLAARVRQDGPWLLVGADLALFRNLSDDVLAVFGMAGSIAGEVALYTDDPADQIALVDGLREKGWAVSVSGDVRETPAIDERRAPVQENARHQKPPGTISWEEHVEAWNGYAARYGRSQSAERIAERHGFCYGEVVELLGREPKTWRPR